jgi:hypothetical protein
MAEELLCPVCGIGRMKRTGLLAATSRDEERNEIKGNFRGYKCDNPDCGYPEGGQHKVASVKEYIEMEEEERSATKANNKYKEQG